MAKKGEAPSVEPLQDKVQRLAEEALANLPGVAREGAAPAVDVRADSLKVLQAARETYLTALGAVLEASRIFDGLLPAASTALDGHIHSVDEIERGYMLANEAHQALTSAEDRLVEARAALRKAETETLEVYRAELLVEAKGR